MTIVFNPPSTIVPGPNKKDVPFKFDEECLAAFETLKKKLTTCPIIAAPDWNEPFEMMCDFSDYAVGAILGQ